jgi:monovalent cation/hydrogen antiporter
VIIQKKMAQTSLQFLEERFDGNQFSNDHIENLYARLLLDQKVFEQQVNEGANANGDMLESYHAIYLEILERQRKMLNDMNHRSESDEDLIRKYLSLTDTEEYKLREKLLSKGDSKE